MLACNGLRRSFYRGFSLVEMLVVVGIILLLMGLVLPVLARVRQERMKLLAKTEVKLIRDAALLYHEQLNGFPPDTDDFGTGDVPEMVTDPYSIYRYLGREITDSATGKMYGPYFRAKLKYVVGPPGQEVYMDPWNKPYRLDALHTTIVTDRSDPKEFGKVLRRGSPYPPATPEEKQILEIKVFSNGPDGEWNAGDYAQQVDGKGNNENYDNITSWAD